MSDNQITFAAAQNSFGTSAHETGTILSTLPLNSNSLRYYSPVSGARKRQPSSTAAMRNLLAETLLAAYPSVRRVKIKDCGQLFSARAWLYGGRVAHCKAYSLPNLRNLLCEQIREKQGEA